MRGWEEGFFGREGDEQKGDAVRGARREDSCIILAGESKVQTL